MTELDARGLLCPLPVLRLRKALLAMPAGATIRLIATDRMAMVDVPHFCGQAGHVMIGMRDLGDGVMEFTDVEALVMYLAMVPWDAPNFSVDKHADQLTVLGEHMPLRVTQRRFRLYATKA